MKTKLILCGLCCLFAFSSFAANGPKNKSKRKTEPHDVQIEMASFPGGGQALSHYISQNIQYPSAAQKQAVEGKVKVIFAIGSDGQVFDVEIVEGIGYGCDEEAKRLIKSMPKWSPAYCGKEPIGMHLQLSIPFKF